MNKRLSNRINELDRGLWFNELLQHIIYSLFHHVLELAKHMRPLRMRTDPMAMPTMKKILYLWQKAFCSSTIACFSKPLAYSKSKWKYLSSKMSFLPFSINSIDCPSVCWFLCEAHFLAILQPPQPASLYQLERLCKCRKENLFISEFSWLFFKRRLTCFSIWLGLPPSG